MKMFSLIASAMVFSASAMAASPSGTAISHSISAPSAVQHEISGGTNAQFRVGGGDGFKDVTTINAGYGYFFSEMLEASGNFNLIHSNGLTVYTLTVGPTFNFLQANDTVLNSFFLSPVIGLARASYSGLSTTDFAYGLEVGKRFALTSTIAWKPSIAMTNTTATGSDPTFTISPIAFSLIF
ncbi:MAG: outer membrane beta-barrel protein [Cryobacterium sp.]|nr:outer membrane beta-barrel protein [Oligoflexia bacterium]